MYLVGNIYYTLPKLFLPLDTPYLNIPITSQLVKIFTISKISKINYRLHSKLPFLFLFLLVGQPLLGQGLHIVEASQSHSRHTTLGTTPLER